MSDEDERLQRQMAQIGDRYLQRTLDELPLLRNCLRQVSEGEEDAWDALAQLAHKIYGSGAMFEFEEVSDRAGKLERLARGDRNADAPQRVEAMLAELEAAVRAAARSRGLIA